jgi:cytoskeletal protein CcmA (bactofilin family)
MAISGFGRGKQGESTSSGAGYSSSPAPSAAPSGGGGGGLTAFIDQGSQFEGKLSFKDTVRIDGEFSGEISSENTLIVGETGEITATIRSNMVVVSGTVVGDIYAGRQIVLHKTARVEGDLECPSITIEEGALFNGQLKMGGGSNASKLKPVDGGQKDAPKAADGGPGGSK